MLQRQHDRLRLPQLLHGLGRGYRCARLRYGFQTFRGSRHHAHPD